MSMESDEKAAEVEVERHWKNDKAPETGDDACDLVRRSFLAGATHGRKAERERIYRAANDAKWTVVPHGMPINENCTAVFLKTLKNIIFGGEGEKDK